MSSNGWQRSNNTPAAKARRREYNSAEYKRAKAEAKRIVDAEQARCWRCRQWIAPGSDWHLGHDDWNRHIIRGAECARCNLHAAARKGGQVAKARREGRQVTRPTRRWVL